MSIIFHKLYRLLVLTKRFIFKNFLTKILFFALVLFFLSSFNKPFPEPVYYEIDFGDGVTHLWSRQVYYDLAEENGLNAKLNYRFDNMDEKEFTFKLSKRMYLDSRDSLRNSIKKRIDDIYKKHSSR
jgi:hypothetical protein